MEVLNKLKPEAVFKYFEEICAVPRGSGDMEKISSYCMVFAKKHSLKAVRDKANNVIIYKNGSKGYENCEPVILQGHLDMVCQKDEGCGIDFKKDGLDVYIDGDFIKARGTTLGADNGIAVAMILAILESDSISHPPVEAVFTTDEEIGMIGAGQLDFSKLRGKKMINIDSEEQDVLTVSCAGGSDFQLSVPRKTVKKDGTCINITLKGLKGGHSGVEINSGRVNANCLMARILNYAKKISDFEIISVNGGDKSNAIPVKSSAQLLVKEPEEFIKRTEEYALIIKKEIAERESGFLCEISTGESGNFDVLEPDLSDKLVYMLLCAPNGVMEMSAEIENLVETSLNLGILKTEAEKIIAHFALRSNKKSALEFLEEKLTTFSECINCEVKTFGHYPPWEYKENSELQRIYKEKFKEKFGMLPSVEAIHAGLECGVFAANIEGIDCISIGPEMHDVHTTKERLSISSTKEIFEVLVNVLKECK